ncbi:hypothetical protein LINPERPRIM_LOCUS13120 [Linum perenne]
MELKWGAAVDRNDFGNGKDGESEMVKMEKFQHFLFLHPIHSTINLKPHSATTTKNVLCTQSSGEWSDVTSSSTCIRFIDRDNDDDVSRDDLAALLNRLGAEPG